MESEGQNNYELAVHDGEMMMSWMEGTSCNSGYLNGQRFLQRVARPEFLHQYLNSIIGLLDELQVELPLASEAAHRVTIGTEAASSRMTNVEFQSMTWP